MQFIEKCNTQDFESQESKGNPKFRRDSASPRKDSASRSGVRVDKKVTNSTSRPSRLGESGLCEENPKSGAWSLFNRLILLPKAPLLSLTPKTPHPKPPLCSFKLLAILSDLKEEEEVGIFEASRSGLGSKVWGTFQSI